MNRREALQRAAALMGGTLSAPATLGILNGCLAAETVSQVPSVLSASQFELVAAVADIIIPRTTTPGAKDVGVPMLIDSLLKDVYPAHDRERYLAGLAEFDAAAEKTHGAAFLALDAKRQSALVHKFHDDAIADEIRLNRPEGSVPPRPFILMTKELTLLGFFTSYAGDTQVLQYAAIPGAYHACLPLSEAGNGHAWATEPGIRF